MRDVIQKSHCNRGRGQTNSAGGQIGGGTNFGEARKRAQELVAAARLQRAGGGKMVAAALQAAEAGETARTGPRRRRNQKHASALTKKPRCGRLRKRSPAVCAVFASEYGEFNMMFTATNDLDYLATRLHARRSRMAEGDRLDALCDIRTIPELSRTVGLDTEYQAAAKFQRRWCVTWPGNLPAVRDMSRRGGELFAWMLARFQVENIKMLVRGLVNQTSPEVLQEHLVSFRRSRSGRARTGDGGSLEDFIELLPPGTPRQRLSEAVAARRDHPQPFFLEAPLTAAIFRNCWRRPAAFGRGSGHRQTPRASGSEFFSVHVGGAGRFHYNLPSDALLSLRLPGIFDDWFRTLLTAPTCWRRQNPASESSSMNCRPNGAPAR